MGELQEGFGKRVRQLRDLRGLTQAELAERAGVSIEWVRRIERGVAGPSFDTIEALGKALDVQVRVPLGLPQDASAEQRLVAEVQGLSGPDQEWLWTLIQHLGRRPGHVG